jgi:hypothetical protein
MEERKGGRGSGSGPEDRLSPSSGRQLTFCSGFTGQYFNPFTAEVAIMRLLGSAPMSHLCDQKRRSKVTGLPDLMTLFVDLNVDFANRRKEHSMFSKTR